MTSIPDVNGLSVHDAAVAFAEAGLRIFPMRTGTKMPALAWLEGASSDPVTVAGWYAPGGKYAGCGIGLPMRLNGLFAFDIDSPDELPDDLRAALAAHPTCTHTSNASLGKRHYIYSDDVAYSQRFQGAWGETRGPGYLTVAPTLHPDRDGGPGKQNGGGYSWLSREVAPLPDELAAFLDAEASARAAVPGEVSAALATDAPDDGDAGAWRHVDRAFASGTNSHTAMLRALLAGMAYAAVGRLPGKAVADRVAQLCTDAGKPLGEGDRQRDYDRLLEFAVVAAADMGDDERGHWLHVSGRPIQVVLRERREALGETAAASGEDGEAGSQQGAAMVARYALERYQMVRSTESGALAVPMSGQRVAQPLGKPLQSHITASLFDQLGYVPSGGVLDAAFNLLRAKGDETDPVPAYLRAAAVGDEVWLDLGHRSGEAFARVTRTGWTLHADAVPLFTRNSVLQPLPTPERPRGDEWAFFARLIGLSEDDSRFRLIRGWLAAAMFSEIPRPLLWGRGQQGSGKSTAMHMVARLIDGTHKLGGDPTKRSEQDLTVGARGRYLPTYDNIGKATPAFSDWLCRLITGSSDDRRALYTDGDLTTVSVQRTGVATSVLLPHELGADALERIIQVRFSRLPDNARRSEAALWAEFDRLEPRLLGAVLDDVASVLRERDAVKVDTLPRMADYGIILHALDAGTGGGFAAAYRDSLAEAMREKVTDDPWRMAIVDVARRGGGPATRGGPKTGQRLADAGRDGEGWIGSASELVAAVDLAMGDDRYTSKVPGLNGIRARLLMAAEPLAAVGVIVEPDAYRTRHETRPISLTVVDAPIRAGDKPESTATVPVSTPQPVAAAAPGSAVAASVNPVTRKLALTGGYDDTTLADLEEWYARKAADAPA